MKSFKCICCSVEITPCELSEEEEKEQQIRPESWMWSHGTVERIFMGYGSNLDGNSYYIGICDNCIERKTKEGIIEEIIP